MSKSIVYTVIYIEFNHQWLILIKSLPTLSLLLQLLLEPLLLGYLHISVALESVVSDYSQSSQVYNAPYLHGLIRFRTV